MKIDLHLHTNASDGVLSPERLVARAAELGLSFIAITDHDSVEGIAPALAAAQSHPGLAVIPGVEISTDVPRGEVHMLGYFIDYGNAALQDTLARLRLSRIQRAKSMVEKLNRLGVGITWQRVQELAQNSSVGRPHLAQAMLEKGYITSHQEAFTKYIGREGPAYVEREKMTPREAAELIARSGGLPVLAHPGDIPQVETLLAELRPAGLVGLEVFYNGYAPPKVQELKRLAQRHRLIPCGGSDYHGLGADFEREIGSLGVPLSSVQALYARAQRPLALS